MLTSNSPAVRAVPPTRTLPYADRVQAPAANARRPEGRTGAQAADRPARRIVIVGGGVGGIGASLVLSRRGHDVTVVERDDTPMPRTADEAFTWDRRGAPQVRQSHAFLGRLVGILRTGYPDVYAALLAEGATEMRFGEDLPPTLVGFTPEPGDEELVMLVCRRSTFEWVLRRAVLEQIAALGCPVRLLTGTVADGLLTDAAANGSVPAVRGVRLSDGSELPGDLVVVASAGAACCRSGSRRSAPAPPAEEVDDTGIVYFCRFYRLRDGADFPRGLDPSVATSATSSTACSWGTTARCRSPSPPRSTTWSCADAARSPTCSTRRRGPCVVTAPFLDGRAEPITDDVHVMAGLLNRWREYVVDGEPLATGVIPIGDAVLCTNPLYGRGCSTAFWAAEILAECIDDHPRDPRSLAVRYDERLRGEILPWYRAGVQQDAEARTRGGHAARRQRPRRGPVRSADVHAGRLP